MTPLQDQHCVPCEGGVLPLERNAALKLAAEVNHWNLADDALSINREFVFKDFTEALAFVNKVAVVAQEQDHHPDIHWWWNKVKLELTTHAIKGLSNNDFIMAAKINQIFK
jgi:4a-hydroxytetrahydrobiopterin dehydratase